MLRFLVVLFTLGLAACGQCLAGDFISKTSDQQSRLKMEVNLHGSGRKLVAGDVVIAHYVGSLVDGTKFDSSRDRGRPFAFTLSRPATSTAREIKRQVIQGWDEGFRKLRIGDKAKMVVPPELAYGPRALEKIPSNSTLIFDVEVLDAKEYSLADSIRDDLDRGGLDLARSAFNEKRGDTKYYVDESQLNSLGYSLLGDDQFETALQIFEWNVALFPQSGNVYDSLGEAYLKLGDQARSLDAYKRAVEFDPANANARNAVAELEAKIRGTGVRPASESGE